MYLKSVSHVSAIQPNKYLMYNDYEMRSVVSKKSYYEVDYQTFSNELCNLVFCDCKNRLDPKQSNTFVLFDKARFQQGGG